MTISARKKSFNLPRYTGVLLAAPLALLCVGVAAAPVSVEPRLETPALFDDDAGGNADADDPAIWVHPLQPDKSVVVATKKDAGLSVYNLGGAEIQAIAAPPAPGPEDAAGRFNNTDLLYGFELGNRKVDLAVVTDRGSDKLRIYVINPRAAAAGEPPLSDVTDPSAPFLFSSTQSEVNDQATGYGLAVYRDNRSGRSFAYVSQRSRTTIAKIELLDVGGRIGYRKVQALVLPDTFVLPDSSTWTPCTDPGDGPQVEGMVVDQDQGILYAGQEAVGIWKIGLQLDVAKPELIDKVREYGVPYTYDSEEEECIIDFAADPGYGGENLSADVEGLTIYYAVDTPGYLLASSQGDNTFAVYERRGSNRYIGSFALTDTDDTDSVQESDGAAVVNVPLGRSFPGGLLVTQDGDNTPEELDEEGEERDITNFKFTPWPSVARAFAVPLAVDPLGWNPRTGY
ncbi:MAG: phytase [Gemmatimonadaceae bacterium]|nr:phytase [Gloeobacterales cyanobacterium ES-bin-141]